MLTRLAVANFRCFSLLEILPEPGANFFVGANAQGKTSILEAVCVLLRGQSPRARSLNEAVRHSEAGFSLAGTVDATEMRFFWEGRKRALELNGGPAGITDYFSLGRVVWFGNEDLTLITGAAGLRRRYLDFVGQQADAGYRNALARYNRAVSARNALLREGAESRIAELVAYEEVMAPDGEYLRESRGRLVKTLESHAAEAHARISAGAAESLAMLYEPSGGEAPMADELAAARERDLRLRMTTVGPHRDEITLLLCEKSAGRFASEGQQRTIALALKCAQQAVLLTAGGPPPVLLIDDIFGELDLERRRALLATFPSKAQWWVTATHLDWVEDLPQASRRWQLREGRIVGE